MQISGGLLIMVPMKRKTQPVPEGFHTVTPYLMLQGASEAIEFYKRAFGAKERFRLPGPDGKGIGHAEIMIGNSIIMLADTMAEFHQKSPKTLGGSPVNFAVYVEDVDAVFQQAVEAGATVTRPVKDMFYGDRVGCLVDPFGHQWSIMTHKEDVSPEELERRLPEEYAKMAQVHAAEAKLGQ